MRKICLLIFLLTGSVLILFAAPLIGMEFIEPTVLFHPHGASQEARIFWQLRLPRVLLAFLAGGGLAIGGMTFQALFRNPLATPFTLGIASGASLGAAVYFRLGLSLVFYGFSGQSLFAFAGALLAIGFVYALTRLKRGFSTATMLLAGVAISFFFSSLILFVQFTSDPFDSFRILRWVMGGLSLVGFQPVQNVLPMVAVGAIVIAWLSRDLNLMTTGEELATSRGVNVNRLKGILFFVISLMVGGIVAICGPIGFVGLMCPHICRLMIGPDHRHLAPATFLFGGAFLVVCDTAAQRLFAPAQLPVGVLTAFLGGPFFLWLLIGGSSEKSLV